MIAGAGGELTEEELAALVVARDAAVSHWEKAIAATVVHYINAVLADMAKPMRCAEEAEGEPTDGGCAAYGFEEHAKHWSELKGFALGLQFNRLSPLSDLGFSELHQLVGDSPALPDPDGDYPDSDADGTPDYQASLERARELVRTTYGFDRDNTVRW